MQRLFGWALAFAAVLWVAALVAAPYGLGAGSALAGVFYEACGLICHQRPERSFHVGEVHLPVCARCFGLYVSGAAGALVAALASLRIRVLTQVHAATARRLLFGAALPTAVTLLLEWSMLMPMGPAARATAAVPLGCVLGWLLVRTVQAERTVAVAPQQMRYHA